MTYFEKDVLSRLAHLERIGDLIVKALYPKDVPSGQTEDSSPDIEPEEISDNLPCSNPQS